MCLVSLVVLTTIKVRFDRNDFHMIGINAVSDAAQVIDY